MPMDTVALVGTPVRPTAWKCRLIVHCLNGAQGLNMLHSAEPRKENVKHEADAIQCLDAPAVHELVRPVLFVRPVQVADADDSVEADELLGH